MKQFLSLQYLRAAAALGVVLFHFTHQKPLTDEAAGVFERGQFGVDLFFVLSGFIMQMSTSGREMAPAAFLGRRIARVAPLYWAATLAAAMIATDPALSFGLHADGRTLLSSLLFIPDWSPKTPGVIAPLLTVGWTLNLEMAFYALFALGLFLPVRLRLPLVGGVLAALGLAGLWIDTGNPAIEAYTNSAVIEFAYGMALARFHESGALKGEGGEFLIAGGLGLALLVPFDLGWRGLTFGPAAAAIVAGFVLLDGKLVRRPVKAAKLLGDASYSLYLTHGMALASMALLLRKLGVEGPLAAIIAAEVAVASLAAVVIYFAIERPLTRAARRLADGRMAPSARERRIFAGAG
ncbi:MAG: acyltransferase family protein [Pseudomonadota bacterium]